MRTRYESYRGGSSLSSVTKEKSGDGVACWHTAFHCGRTDGRTNEAYQGGGGGTIEAIKYAARLSNCIIQHDYTSHAWLDIKVSTFQHVFPLPTFVNYFQPHTAVFARV